MLVAPLAFHLGLLTASLAVLVNVYVRDEVPAWCKKAYTAVLYIALVSGVARLILPPYLAPLFPLPSTIVWGDVVRLVSGVLGVVVVIQMTSSRWIVPAWALNFCSRRSSWILTFGSLLTLMVWFPFWRWLTGEDWEAFMFPNPAVAVGVLACLRLPCVCAAGVSRDLYLFGVRMTPSAVWGIFLGVCWCIQLAVRVEERVRGEMMESPLEALAAELPGLRWLLLLQESLVVPLARFLEQSGTAAFGVWAFVCKLTMSGVSMVFGNKAEKGVVSEGVEVEGEDEGIEKGGREVKSRYDSFELSWLDHIVVKSKQLGALAVSAASSGSSSSSSGSAAAAGVLGSLPLTLEDSLVLALPFLEEAVRRLTGSAEDLLLVGGEEDEDEGAGLSGWRARWARQRAAKKDQATQRKQPLVTLNPEGSGGIQSLTGLPKLFKDTDGDVAHEFRMERKGKLKQLALQLLTPMPSSEVPPLLR
uniref:Uncharacterized protein n=1 Tax=Chromera velia CCMP2878 TaxID=1169474 RepID=A0A0G4F4A7_9ALVE|mmetsp:Transcript_18961/g.38313  ORF Transcript_18961/g.38313 Transcript_18961/m.38313 type:complete len:474 (-) Transcript_18961:91-1512(-)|eukprot:Cvel_15144.t1-p1 / transcript=Cvel_15144.t1 / gene=Cvel_15144 / organism=Chromera_velia_CCMP2878 / gene_product=hypothetical protein / transcript_product=hypothetical protein / location=Cvel_scaffold1105:48947-52597(-) / protein_length=473 / sequence_SO=supercontig / SO=protein_coding / is_pseudo=false